MALIDNILSLAEVYPNTSNYFDTLYPPSWRGLPFVVETARNRVGRAIVEHTYPYRDQVWPEDMRKLPRRFQLSGFIVGDDVIAQRDAMETAANIPGPGTLVHPSYGALDVVLLNLDFDESKEHGRVIRVTFNFIQYSTRLYPKNKITTQVGVVDQATNANQAIASDFSSGVTTQIAYGDSVVAQIAGAATQWVGVVNSLAYDATNVFHLASELPGPFGRFYPGSTGSSTGSVLGGLPSPSDLANDVEGLITTASINTAAIATAGATAIAAATDLVSPMLLAGNLQDVAIAMLTAITDPADAVRIFTQLQNFVLATLPSTSPLGMAEQQVINHMADICRRVAVIALAQAAANYQPSSQNDALTLQNTVCGLLDDEINIAGDQGEDQTFLNLKGLRDAVAQDLITRGAALPSIQKYSMNAAQPALALSYQYYDDITRTDELIGFANPIHPAFMPTQFQALSS